jgi:hypothetical protein
VETTAVDSEMECKMRCYSSVLDGGGANIVLVVFIINNNIILNAIFTTIIIVKHVVFQFSKQS